MEARPSAARSSTWSPQTEHANCSNVATRTGPLNLISARPLDDTEIRHGLGQVQPNRWERAPVFDREGRPVRYLAGRAKQRLRVPAARRSDRTARRRMLADIVDASGLCRPAVQIRKKKRGGK